MNIAALDTPALAADLDVLERNINGMATHCHQLKYSPARSYQNA